MVLTPESRISQFAVLAPLVALSRRYGSDPDWVLAGGGNTSFKTSDRLYVKASGFALATIGEDGFCAMDRGRLDAIWRKTYPDDRAAREKAALADLMDGRLPGETKRPSVETLLHGFFPQAYVVHTHPALVNGLTCGRNGESAFQRLFSREGIWVPLVDPGYVLARTVRGIFEAFVAEQGKIPSFMFMQNHGLLVAGDSPEEIVSISGRIVAVLRAELSKLGVAPPDFEPLPPDSDLVGGFERELRAIADGPVAIVHRSNRAVLRFAASAADFAPIAAPFSPDQIVYAGHEYLRVDGAKNLADGWAAYVGRNGTAPRVVLGKDLGAFAIAVESGANDAKNGALAAAERIMSLFLDSCKVAGFSAGFGGPLHMTPDSVAFIRNWEVEQYRSSLTSGR
ncbi:MAG: class II aldolase/adducin family protein [Rectinemataceae bacterium]